MNAVDVDDVSVDSPVVTESEGEDDFGSEGEQAEEVASEEESEEEIDGQFDADGAHMLPNYPPPARFHSHSCKPVKRPRARTLLSSRLVACPAPRRVSAAGRLL